MPEKPVEQQPPDVLAMVLADAILQDFASAKFFIHGTYSGIFAQQFPLIYPAISLYLAITNGHGKTEMKVRLVDVDENREPVFEATAGLDFADPLQVLEMVFVARNVRFPEPGEYRIQLLGAGQLIRERRLQVMPIPGSEEGEQS